MIGKPGIGLNNMRKLTLKERRLTGLSASVFIMHEHGTGNITFWTANRYQNSCFDNASLGNDWRRGHEKTLEAYWSSPKRG